MAGIAIIDDWGKEQYRIKVAGSAHDIANDVCEGLGGGGYERCVTCQTYTPEADCVMVDSEEVEYACKKCMGKA